MATPQASGKTDLLASPQSFPANISANNSSSDRDVPANVKSEFSVSNVSDDDHCVGSQAARMLGDTRSKTKAICELIDLTNPKSVHESSIKTAMNSKINTPLSSSARTCSNKPASNSCSKPTLSTNESKYPVMQAKEFPSNWMVREIPRSQGNKRNNVDRYYYSPVNEYKFRSKKEVCRFLECLKKTRGDEALAFEELRGSSKSPPGGSCAPQTTPSSRYKVLEYVEPPKTVFKKNGKEMNRKERGAKEGKKEKSYSERGLLTNRHVKPVIKKGEKVYACWSGGSGRDWFPGRVWDIKESPGAEYGPERTYDVVFDDGDTEPNVGEIWIATKADYEMCLEKPEEEDWIGVTNVRFPDSKDEYARMVGWYETSFDVVQRVYWSLGEALRAHDKHTIEIRGRDNISAKDLNFPKEHNILE